MYLDAPPAYSNQALIHRQLGPLVAALPRTIAGPLPEQPLLFMWGPNLLYNDGWFATLPGQPGPWKAVQYNMDACLARMEAVPDRDSESLEDQRLSRIIRWCLSVWPEMKRELLQYRQMGNTGGTSSAVTKSRRSGNP